ncbi:Gfo/Idh/MocA family protein [Wenxinia saemankumensis]|uniref:Predicted dehydrogenase n=1 Tax=Wenxinia saemankumensis TaxID=1447782 RepID=A0A1M6HSL6_9RHOB|nr:Gfo/Idh/MocA family oxidoreductase [Wenxinia saemankumensis]SHJ25114.1 Predicted dehydrogenase [Wenxinia saemankumensis]
MSLRIAMVGAGWVTEHHLAAYRRLGGAVSVVAIADPDPAARAERAARWGIPRTFSTDTEMLDAVAVDALDVASPREHHAASVALGARRGLAILCQKPLAPTWDAARALVDGLPPGTRLMVNENWRHRPHYGRIRDWVAGGRIGRLRRGLLQARTSGFLPDGQGALPALARQPMLAGLERMLLMEILIHHVDALRSVVGEMDLLGAALGADTPALRGEDMASLLFRAGPAAVSVIGDFRSHGAPPGLTDELELQGTEGAIALEGDRLALRRPGRPDEEEAVDLAADYTASYQGMIAQFVAAVAAGDPRAFAAQVEDNLATLRLIERAYALGRDPALPAPAG